MKKLFGRQEEVEEVLDEDDFDVINLDETAGWSKLEVAEELAKKRAALMMEEIGDELAIIDVVEEDVEIEELKPRIRKSVESKEQKTRIKENTYIEPKKVVLQELPDEMLDEDIEMEELQDEDIEYLSDEEEQEEAEERISFLESMGEFFSRWTVMDKVVAVTGVLVLAVAIVTAGVYAVNRSVDKQIAAFAPVGEQLESIGVVGQDKLLAVADAKKAMMEAAKIEAEVTQQYVESDVSSVVKVVMKMTSVEKDLKIKFVNKKTGKLVGNVPFEVKITDGENKTYNKADEDRDGIIYLTKIPAGNYSVSMVELSGVEGYSFSTYAETIRVKDKIVYEKIDVTEEIKDQSEVDVSKEDTAQKVETESVLTDTVEWVESTKQETNSQETYVQVNKDTIADPALSASLKLDLDILRVMQQSMLADHIAVIDEDGGNDNEKNDVTNENEIPTNPETKPTDPETKPADPETKPTEPAKIEVSSIKINETPSLKVGESCSLSVSFTPSDATDKSLSWNSGNTAVATVDDSGNVTAVAKGTAEITVTSNNGKTATCTVTVEEKTVEVNSIKINENPSLTVGDSYELTVTFNPADVTNTSLTWSSKNTSVATVDGNGKVTAAAKGSTEITATSNNGKTATCTVTVEEKMIQVDSITVNEKLSLKVGESCALSVTFNPSNATDKSLKWSSDKTAVATVDNNGKVTAVAKGSAKITVTSNNGKTAVCNVEVVDNKISVTEVALNKNTLELAVGSTETLTATVKPENATDKTVTWSTSDTAIATVDTNGKVTAVKEGTATITVTTKDSGKKAECKVTVKPKTTEISVSLDKTSASMKVDETLTLTAKVTPEGKKVTWKSSDETKATVDENGKVTAKAEGKVDITATVDNKTATCNITISKVYDAKNDTTTSLKDKSGNQIYVLVDGNYVEAKVADYYKHSTFYKKEKVSQYTYTGWQNLDGRTYYFDKNGNKVTGEQIIQGAKYSFNSDGTLNTGSGILGIDVSTWNGNIDWNKVKNSGVSYVIIRTGFRGSTQGALVEDNRFRQNIQGATNAGLKVGVYFFSQAVNEVEAVEEASMVLSQIKGYPITYPVFIDVEPSGGRADALSSGDRTKVINAFCQTIQNGGYKAGIYANKTWLAQKMNISALSGYKIWLAQYNSTVTYGGRYDMWQYSDKGTVAGINGQVDMNLSYLSY